MEDAALVSELERRRDLPRDRQRVGDRNRSTPQPFGQRLALDQLQHDRVNTVGRFEAVDGGNVRVIECCQRLGFPLEARATAGILGKEGGQDLQGDLALQSAVARAIHLAHAARADR